MADIEKIRSFCFSYTLLSTPLNEPFSGWIFFMTRPLTEVAMHLYCIKGLVAPVIRDKDSIIVNSDKMFLVGRYDNIRELCTNPDQEAIKDFQQPLSGFQVLPGQIRYAIPPTHYSIGAKRQEMFDLMLDTFNQEFAKEILSTGKTIDDFSRIYPILNRFPDFVRKFFVERGKIYHSIIRTCRTKKVVFIQPEDYHDVETPSAPDTI